MPHEQTNFYSFLIWYLLQQGGILAYDYKEHHYTITGKKKEASAPPLEVFEWFVTPPLYLFSKSPRFNEKIIKHTADTLDNEDKENQDSFKSVRRENFDTNNYRVYPEQAHQKILSPLMAEKNEIEVEFIRFTKEIHLDKLTPGSYLCFKGDKEGNWTRDPCFKDKKFRVRSLEVTAKQFGPQTAIQDPTQNFTIYIKGKLEEEEERVIEWPRFTPPTFPFYVQGKVFCDIGDKEQSTYKILESEKAPQGQYLVHVPLAGEKHVVTPFVPSYSGQYYYPYSKDARVMLSMHFRTARIERPIDWDPLTRLPAGVQGNQMVLASNGKDKYLVMRHEYVDGKDSVYTIKQSSSEEQVQTVEIKEKNIMITVDEKEKKTLLVQLNHDSGFVVSFEDKKAGSLQQIVFDGKSMTHTCKGSDGISVIIQKPDSIAIECKEFTIKSETILLDAADAINIKAKNSIDLKAKLVNGVAPAVKLGE